MRRIGAQLAGMAVLVSAVGPMASAEAVPALPDSSTLTSPVVLQGRLTDAAGAALSGAEVLLSAWPSNTTVKAMPIGGTFRTVPVARAVVDSTGAYTLRAALTPALATLIDRDGLDLQLDVAQQGSWPRTYLTQAVPGGALGWLRPTVDAVDPASLVAALPRNSWNIALPTEDGPHPCGNTPGCEEKPRPFPGANCVNRKIAEKKAWTTVATAVARDGVTALVTYERGAQSEVSTGVSVESNGVGFKSNGSRTRGSTIEAKYTPRTGTAKKPVNVEYQVRMKHAVIASECLGNKVGQYRYRQFMTDPLGTSGGFRPITSRLPVWTCARANTELADGDSASTVSDRAYTYEKGFGFSPVPGGSYTGSATSGYSETVKVQYDYAKIKGKKGYWCGRTGDPASPGQRVQAFQK